MVSSLGGIPLANPLQNPVTTGLGQYYNAVYSPLQMMAAPIQAMAMANMYGDRGMYYADQGQLASQKAGQIGQGYGTNSAGQTAYTLANQQGQPAAQQYLTSVAAQPGAQVGVDLSRAPLLQQQQQLAAQRQQQVANQAALTGQEAVNLGGNPPVMNPSMVGGIAPNSQGNLTPQGNSPGQMQQLQGQLGQLSGQSQQQYNYNQSFDQWSPQDQMSYMKTNNVVPDLPMGTTINSKIDATTQTKINAMPQIAGQLSQLKQLYNDPSVAPYVGKNASNYIAAAQAQMARGGQVPVGYQNYQAAMNLSNMVTDGITRTMAGSRAATIMAQFNKSFNGGNAYGLPQFNQTVSQAAQDAYNSASTYVGTNYPKPVRQTAYMGAQRLANSGLLPSSQTQQSATAAPQSSLISGIPDSFVQQYMQQKGWGK